MRSWLRSPTMHGWNPFRLGSTHSLPAFGTPRVSKAEVDELGACCHSTFSQLRPLLERRAGKGHVKRCHGDLHLANIVLIEDKPVLFDAIEFDDRIAVIDVLYDLAFPLMDFLHF